MRHITRLPKPDILAEKEQEWLDNFTKSGKSRPDNNKYGHKDILEALQQSSHHKCFYCETILKGITKEIDHYVEVSISKTKAFEWENLYLACENCNNKIPHNKISVNDVLNPCADEDEEIQKHIYFDNELIRFFTQKGEDTIKKYKLDTEKMDLLRLRELQKFTKFYSEIEKKLREKGKKKLNKKQKQNLKNYMQKDNVYSLMFKYYLENNKII